MFLFVLLQACVLLLQASALVPPHPDFVDHETSRQLSQMPPYNYEPKHIPLIHCLLYLTEERCQQLDEEYGAQHAGRRLNTRVGNRIRVLVLLVKFPDTTYPLPARDDLEQLFNGNGPNSANPIGSIKDWLRYNSLGKYRVSFDVRDWQTAEHNEDYYAGGSSGFGVSLESLFEPILTKMDNANSVDWTDGYIDEFGYLNHLVVLHSGFSGEAGNKKCLPTDSQDRIWSQGSGGPSGSATWTSKELYEVSGYLVSSAFALPACDRNTGELNPVPPAKIAIIAHEYCHGFLLPDLYDQSGTIQVGGIGKFGTMGSLQGWDFNSDTGGHLSCWSRATIGWVEPILIVRDGYYAIQPLEIANSCYKIEQGYAEFVEYLLIENKQIIKWDADVKQGGIVIFHVDEDANRQSRPGYPGSSGWPKDHYKVAVVQADRLFQIEKGENFGDEGDFWIQGMKLGSGGEHPNTDSYWNGIVKPTGVSIEILSNSGFIMMFRVTGIGSRSVGLLPPGEDPSVVEDDSEEDYRGENDSTGEGIAWLLAMLGGLGMMLGLMVLMF
jgi:M6 family metalloprotease-like protein